MSPVVKTISFEEFTAMIKSIGVDVVIVSIQKDESDIWYGGLLHNGIVYIPDYHHASGSGNIKGPAPKNADPTI